MPFPIDVTRCLAFAPTDTPLEVCSIPSDELRARLALEALFEGDEIIREPDASGLVITRLANDRRVLIEHASAVRIEVAVSGTNGVRVQPHELHARRSFRTTGHAIPI